MNESYEYQLIDELTGIVSLRGADVDRYAYDVELGYVIVYHDQDGYHVIENCLGIVSSEGPGPRGYMFGVFREWMNSLGGES